ncbi:MAG: hypothetical protein GF353_13600 [Candidatus Lokiarchaeota archaeon]|nr:hypothetical protein [Candidatus Lokiarchaeota archaeon]
MKIACIQPQIFPTKKECFADIETILKKVLEENDQCDIVCLPERYIPFIEEIPKNLQKERGNSYQFVQSLAKEYSVNFISGAIWEKRNNSKKPYITCYFFNRNGEEIGRQDKIHLYTYERKYFTSGRDLKLFRNKKFSFSILICFDMAN